MCIRMPCDVHPHAMRCASACSASFPFLSHIGPGALQVCMQLARGLVSESPASQVSSLPSTHTRTHTFTLTVTVTRVYTQASTQPAGKAAWEDLFDPEDYMDEADASRSSRDMDLASSVGSADRVRPRHRRAVCMCVCVCMCMCMCGLSCHCLD